MSTRPTIMVALLAIASVCCAIFLGPTRQGSGADQRIDHRLFDDAALPLDDVHTITFQRRDEPQHVWIRDGLEWTQEAPFDHPMLTPAIRRLITGARGLRLSHVLPDVENTTDADLGLDPPLATITYAWDEGEQLTVHLGRRAVAGRAYVRVEGRDATLIVDRPDLHQRVLDGNPVDWRHRRLFEDVSIEGHQIAWATQGADGSIGMLLEKERRNWFMREPAATRVDPVNHSEYIEAIAKAAGSGFVMDEPERLDQFGLEDPAGIFTLSMVPQDPDAEGGDTSQRLLIGASCGGGTHDRFAMISGRPVVFRLSAETLASLFKDPATLVDHTASGERAEDIKRVRIDGPDGVIEFERDLERWIATSHSDVRVEPALVEGLIAHLTELRATGVTLMTYPNEMHVANVTLIGFDARPRDTVRIARDPQNGNWAFENGDNALRVHPPGVQPRLRLAGFGLDATLGQAGPQPAPEAADDDQSSDDG